MATDRYAVLILPVDGGGEEESRVAVRVESVSQSEFFSAAQVGFKASYKLTLWASDYGDQPFVRLGGKRYEVYRTYLKPDGKVELYLTEKLGLRYS